MDTAMQALCCLRDQKQDIVVSQWELPDMPDGVFLRKIVATRSGVPTIAFIKAGDHKQEALARSLGVSAVLNEDIDDEHFRKMICHLLSIYTVELSKAVDA
jgi:DNA-binding NtrC family response regulator